MEEENTKLNIFTEERKAKIRQKLSATPQELSRNPLSNYKEGYFHITLNVHDGLPILGTVEGSINAPRGTENAPHVRYSNMGKAVKEVWRGCPSFFTGVEILALEVMPEHIHCLMHLKKENSAHLGRIVNGAMIGSTHAYWDELGIEWRKENEQLKGNAKALDRYHDRDHTGSSRGPSLFIHGYNDVEAVTEEQVAIKIEYIRANPERRLIKGELWQIFAIARNKHSRNWNLEAIKRGLMQDKWMRMDANSLDKAFTNVLLKLNMQIKENAGTGFTERKEEGKTGTFMEKKEEGNAGTTFTERKEEGKTGTNFMERKEEGHTGTNFMERKEERHTGTVMTEGTPEGHTEAVLNLDYLGNREILYHQPKVSLICHKADAWIFEKQEKAVMEAARKGAVVVSAFISAKEREIRDRLISEQLSVIEIADNGFNDRYKPSGNRFYACAEGWLLQISCWKYEYQKEKTISREMCMVMNELVRVISGVRDDWWKQG